MESVSGVRITKRMWATDRVGVDGRRSAGGLRVLGRARGRGWRNRGRYRAHVQIVTRAHKCRCIHLCIYMHREVVFV
jgi:hypothetical protein